MSTSRRRADRSFLDGGGELGALMRAHDWSRTPLGPPQHWPRSLKTAVRLMLTSRQPIWLGWGPELTYLYNDPYKSIIGGKHPDALGRPFSEVWREIWDVVGPMADTVMTRDEGTYVESQLLVMERHGYQEETYYTFSYSPLPNDEGGPGGLFCANTDDTRRVIGERQLALLSEVTAKTGGARRWQDACALAMDALRTNPCDLPFALIFLADEPDFTPVAASTSPGAEGLADAGLWPCGDVMRSAETRLVALDARHGDLPKGAWPRPPLQAAVLPIAPPGGGGRAGALVVGLNPFRKFDESYRSFLELVARQVASGLANAQAHEDEKKRAEALAELDRAKTAFFSNVSHEFRTPLTLMLGPLDDLLARPAGELSQHGRAVLTVVHRNGQRLLKLVNTLLDFARIEAGRAHAAYEPTDLSALTADLASNFRSACDRAGLALRVDCPPLAEPAYVDHEMWEKVVLNLVSNAFKFTLEGGIAVATREAADRFELVVSDTGTGIPAEALPYIFERFNRIDGARGRSHEGSGIGLALVQELVRLHGGTIEVASVYGEGTTFTVAIPKGSAHLPAERIKAPRGPTAGALRAGAYVAEALSWLPGEAAAREAPSTAERTHRVLLADDNADLREYARRLLEEHYEVEAVADGEAALAAARARKPDIIVSDVMMPRLDGFGLIRAVRDDAELRGTPVILLSARAGEEARLEGLGRGADDYLVKPFSSRELLVRVGALVQSAQAREALRESDRRKDEFLATLSHELRNPLAPLRNSLHVLRMRGGAQGPVAQVHEIMERQVNHLVRLVDDLLEMSRISRGTLELRRERIEVASVVRNAIETSNPLIQAAEHALMVSLPDAPLWVDGDPVRLAQILSNLLNNAATYSERGGRIEVRARADDGAAAISVRDTGHGIAREELERIFEMFSRGARATVRGQGGLGIGLALARRLAEMHGGSIEVASDGPGRGSEFTVRLALAAQGADEPIVVPAPLPGVAQQRILVVDDNADAGDSLGMILKLMGAEVRLARDGPEAITVFEAFDPAVVLLDIGMPGMDGYEVARRIRGAFPDRRAALVALTGWGQTEDRRKAREAGFDHHLVKPAELADLQVLLSSLGPGAPAAH